MDLPTSVTTILVNGDGIGILKVQLESNWWGTPIFFALVESNLADYRGRRGARGGQRESVSSI